MEERKYDINVHSIRRFFLVISFFVVLLLLAFFNFTEDVSVIEIGVVLLLTYMISYELAVMLSQGKVRIILSEKGFKQVWIKPFIFGQDESFTIPWEDIDSFDYCSAHDYRMENMGPFFDRFFINLSNKRRYTMNRAVSFLKSKDDFVNLIEEFENVSNSFKNGASEWNKDNAIEYKVPRHDFVFRGMFIFSLCALGFFTWMKLSGQIKDMSWWFLIAIAAFSLSYAIKGFRSK